MLFLQSLRDGVVVLVSWCFHSFGNRVVIGCYWFGLVYLGTLLFATHCVHRFSSNIEPTTVF